MRYKIVYQEDNKVKTKRVQTDSIEKQDLPKNIIDIKREFIFFEFKNRKKISDFYIKNILYELSLMLDSKILLDEAFSILIKKEKDKIAKDFLITLQTSFCTSTNINKSLESFNISFLIKSFFQITQNSGNPILNIKSLSNIIIQNHKVKKEFIKSMTYPVILLLTFFFALIGIFKLVVPNFESIFTQSDIELTIATKVLFFMKDIFESYLFYILFFTVFVVFFLFIFYKKSVAFKSFIDKVFVKNLFLISDLYRLKNLYLFFVVVEILLKSKYEFLDSISKAKVLLNNKFLFDRITQIEYLLKSGKSISFAFESIKLFDEITLSLLKTAEVSNSMQSVICEIKNIYKRRFDDRLRLFSLLIEPLFFIIIMGLIVWIILAVFVPLWSMSDMLRV